MAGRMCTGAVTNQSYLLKETKAFSEGIYYRAGGTFAGRPSSDNPHPADSSAYVAWLAGWQLASDSGGTTIDPTECPCVACPTNVIAIV